MMPFRRIKTSKRYLVHIAILASCLLLTAVKGHTQVGIGGSTTVVRGNSYSYYGTYGGVGGYPYNGSYSWSITGGHVTGQPGTTSKYGTAYSYIGSASVNVTWTTTASSGSLYLNTDLGSKTISITVVAPLNAGTISPSSQYINWGAKPSFTNTAASGGASSPSYSYQWQRSTNGSSWTDIAGATSRNYTPDTLQATRYFRRKVTETTSGTIAYTSTVTVNVYPKLTATIASPQTIVYNTAPATLTSSVSGGNGSYTYQWQSSPDSISWTNRVTTSTYSPGPLTSSQFYRLIVTSNGAKDTSNRVKVTVSISASLSVISTTPSGNGSTNVLSCAASGGSAYSYTWYYSTDGGSSYQPIAGATDSAYTTGVITQTTLYYVFVESGSDTTRSNTVHITIPPAPAITADSTTVCNGGNATFTASGGSGNYRWYDISETLLDSGSTYSTSVAGTYYAVSYTDFGISPHSNTITLVSLHTPSASSIIGSTVCVLGSSVQLANTVSGGNWSSSDENIAKADANGVMSGRAAGTATIFYTATNVCGADTAHLGVTVVPFEDISQTLGNGVADPLITDTIALVQDTEKTTEFRQDTAHSSAHSIKNVLALRIHEETGKYIPGDFSATAVLKVEYGHSSADIYELDSIKLHVNYTKNEGAKYNALNYFSFSNAEFTRVTVLRVEAPEIVNGENFDTKEVLLLTNSLAANRYYRLADNKKPELSYTDPGASPVPDQLPVSWILPEHTLNNGIQLEWAWLEDDMKDSYTVGGVFDTTLLFKSSATRIDLPGAAAAGSYDIPLLYDGAGTLYIRVRAVSVMPSGSRSDGPWSGVSTYAFSGHNNNLNWQVRTSFAEEGKRKTVIQYYDGSLRERQTVTKDNTTGQTVVAETFYDMQGRPAVQILPAPGIHNIIAYTTNLNKFNTQADNTNPADHFDFTTVSLGNYATEPLSENSGTAKYYSAQNPDANTGFHKNIPAANGYAYAVTRYTPDATGRIQRQSGAGDSLRMGGGHETRYFYGTPAQEELDALFGTEAGNYTHYFKNMVQDANGQMSVSYSDMHGRTVATALAGESPAALEPLFLSNYPNQAAKTITRNLLNGNSNILKGNSIESINSILVPFNTNHDLSYQLTKQTLTLPTCEGGTISYDCRFDLQISVTDESGDTPPVVYTYHNIDQINFNQVLLLEAGSYSVRKTLTINQGALDSIIALYSTVGVGICKTQQQLIDSIYAADSTGCSVDPAPLTSSDCMIALGDYNAYLVSYADSLGTTVGQLSAAAKNDIRNQYIADSSFCVSLNVNASHTLAGIRKQMLADMVPYSGQYARDTGTTPMAKKYNIFSADGGTHQPFYKRPANPILEPGDYYDPFGNIDISVPLTRLSGMSMTEFENEFKGSWTTSLLPYHPEYAKLVFAEDSLRTAFNFMDSVQLVPAPFNLVASDPFFSIPSRAQDKDSLTRYSNVSWKDMNNYSMWQTAYGDAFGCKVIPDGTARDVCYAHMPKVQTTTGTNVNTGAGMVTLTAAIQAQAWEMYKGLYRQVRDEMMYRFINIRPNKVDTTDNQHLIDQGFRIYFPYSYAQSAKNNHWEDWFPKAGPGGSTGTVDLADSVAVYSSRCDSYIDAWKAALLECPQLADHPGKTGILNSITGKMLEICELGTNGANPYGASTVPPNYSWLPYTSFEQAIHYVLDSAGISTSLLCNPYGIEQPKPYGKNPQVTKQYVAALDDCTCSQWYELGNEINLAGYNKYSLSSSNLYLQNAYGDTLTQNLFTALLDCATNFKYNCRDTVITWEGHPGEWITDTVEVCDTLPVYPLQSPQPLPVFLTCGFDSTRYACYDCADFISFDTAFYNLFGKHPVFNGDVPDSMIVWNDLFARYVNFKTGLSHNWMYYAAQFNTYGCAIGGVSGTGTGLSVCPDLRPLNDTTGFIHTLSPCQAAYNRAADKAGLLYEYLQKQLVAGFKAAYLDACLEATDTFTVAYTIKEYHYTLYYYDQAGNLVKTVPPKGVVPDYSSFFLNAVKTERAKMRNGQPWTPTVPSHYLVTRYNYNSLNQVVIQKTPDAGVSRFWYDRLGRLAVSQNAKQKAQTHLYSYTQYDSLGRIHEVGQITGGSAMTDIISKNETSLQSWLTDASDSRVEITQTIYDTEYGPINGVALSQQNLRNRVSYTQIVNSATDTYPASATYYTYDIHGNVDTLLQDFGNSTGIANAMNQGGNRFKKIVYNYDLISGKVNQVSYQPGEADAYYHRYAYDAENRLTDVYTGRDSVMLEFFPEREARYNYYRHGPLAQTILGQLQVQKQDYAYTLQGWLKGINPDSTISGMIAKNVYGFTLNYYNNDYTGIGAGSPSAGIPSQLGSDNKQLFNGNISSMGVNIPKLGNSILYNFQYDQLNRLVAMDAWSGINNAWGSLSKIDDYQERLSYDANGNILNYLRNGTGGALNLNNYTYSYTAETNRLASITNSVNSSTGTYGYDAIGNVTKDDKQNVNSAEWNVYGKLQSISKTGGLQINYAYEASGNRSLKVVGDTTEAYVRDASGNILSVYKKAGSEPLKQSELNIYGSAMIGTVGEQTVLSDTVVLSGGFAGGISKTFTRGEKEYLLTDHRGNNMISITDHRQQHSAAGTTVDYYLADIKTASYYSTFGAISSSYNSGLIKYGFNGQRRSTEISGTAQTAEFWEYNGDVGRRWNLDPRPTVGISDYVAFANNPIWHTDIKGDTMFRPSHMVHTFEDPLKTVLYETPLGKQLLDEYSKSTSENIYFYAFDLDKSSTTFERNNQTIMNAVTALNVKDNVNSKGELVINNWNSKAKEKGESQLRYLNASGFNFNTSATISIIGLNTTDDKHLEYDKYDLAFAIYHEIYAHVKLAKSVQGEGAQHSEFGNYYYRAGMGLYNSEVVGGSLMVQGSEAWQVFKEILELKIKNGDGTKQNKADLKTMNQADKDATKAANQENKKRKKE